MIPRELGKYSVPTQQKLLVGAGAVGFWFSGVQVVKVGAPGLS